VRQLIELLAIKLIKTTFIYFIIYLILLKAVWKNMKRRGYLDLTNSNRNAMKALRMLLALPLLPSADIQRAFDVMRIFAINHNVPMVDFFEYFQK